MMLTAALVAAGGAVAAAPRAVVAHATTVRCGQRLTASLVVANDLSNCPGNGLVVGADGITIDLGGRTIDGVGLAAGIVVDGHDGVAIRNGRLADFDHGLLVTGGAADVEVDAVSFRLHQEAAVLLAGAGPGADVHDNVFARNALAVGIVDGTAGATVRHNDVADGGGHGVEIVDASHNVVADNEFGASSDGGIVLERASWNTLVRNTVSGVSDAAVAVSVESNGNRLEGNVLRDSDGGFVIEDSAGNIVVDNVVSGMSDVGVDLGGVTNTVVIGNTLRGNGEGVALYDSTDNWIERNDSSESSGTAIAVEGGSSGNVVLANVAAASGASGIAVVTVPGSGVENLLWGNATTANGGAGLTVITPGQSLGSNRADRNRGGGIVASSGTLDLRGNVALGNSGTQCAGVVCNTTIAPVADHEAPTTRITGHPIDPSGVAHATFTFLSDDRHARFVCALDSAALRACTSPVAVIGLAAGDHRFVVHAVDAAGNVERDPAIFDWTVVHVPDLDCGPPVTLVADADAWVDENGADANKGSDSKLVVRSKGPGDDVRSLVRFPMPVIPDRCAVDTATLHLTTDGIPAGRSVHALALSSSWSESTVTWRNQPATSGPPATSPAGDGRRAWDVSALVRATYDAGASHGFVIRDAVEGEDAEYAFATRDSDDPPTLTLRFAPDLRSGTPPDTTPPGTTTPDTTPPDTTTPPTTTPPVTTTPDTTTSPVTTTPDTTTSPVTTTPDTTTPDTDEPQETTPTGTTPPPETTTPPATLPACTTQHLTVLANADSWIEQNSPTNTKGSDSVLKVKSQARADNFRALVGFAMPPVPSGCIVTSATLLIDNDSASSGRTLAVHRTTSPWDERTVSWANQPPVAPASTTAAARSGTVSWDVTALVADAPGAQLGFTVRDTVEDSPGFEQSFVAREKGERPPRLALVIGAP